MPLLVEIEQFLVRADIAATRFGRMATHDPRLIGDLRNGRKLRPRTEAKLRAFLASKERLTASRS